MSYKFEYLNFNPLYKMQYGHLKLASTSRVHITPIHKYNYLFYTSLVVIIANIIYNIYNGFQSLRLLYA